jgi:signal transduction histidine kinase
MTVEAQAWIRSRVWRPGLGRAILTAPFQARTWREFAAILIGAVIAAPAFVLVPLGLVFTVLSLLTVGLPFLTGVLWLARRTIWWFRAPARWLLGWDWPAPRPVGLRQLVTDRTAWRALAYCFLAFPVKYVPAYFGVIALATGTAAVTYPAWWFLTPTAWGSMDARTWAGTWWPFAEGLALLLAFPWLVRAFTRIDKFVAYTLLAPTEDQERIAELEAGREALQADATALMRRVERDLHDGTQARLVALGVTLSRIEGRSTQPDVAELARDGRGTVTEALAELRDIVRGLHPPALDDGLEVALTSLAGRSAVPVEVSVVLTGRPGDAAASAVYFTAAELLTNVARHARATRARVAVSEQDGRLRLEVSDNGVGGAGPTPGGTGLGGLSRRAAALDGTLHVDSPPGGPTTITMELPA